MRPCVTDQQTSHPRKPAISNQKVSTHFTEPHARPESFFLSRSDDMERSRSRSSGRARDSTYGVQSLEEAMELSGEESHHAASDNHGLEDSTKPIPPLLHRMSTVKPAVADDVVSSRPSSSAFGHNQSMENAPSLPLTPLLLGSPAVPGSLPGSPKSASTRSFRRSDEISIFDEVNNHAVEYSDEENPSSSPELQDSASQLVMPSIKMPSRRPFTERGKSLGRLKVMIAGSTGSGKTCLLRSIVQACEDIVHIDPLPHNTSHTRLSNSKKQNVQHGKRIRRIRDRPSIAEIYASTKPYPTWWSDLEDSRVLRRRKSLGDVVLERNLCFVDTVNTCVDQIEQTNLEIQYMIQQFRRATTAIHSGNADLQGLLSGNGGSQVDAILYLISQDTLMSDIQSIKRLSDFSNVIPLIAKADTLSSEQIQGLKNIFIQKAREASIGTFFGDSLSGSDVVPTPRAPFSISSVTTSDDEMMDASVLMSPDYIQPLALSELGFLLDKIFDQDNFAWFRHSAAKKLIRSHNLGKFAFEQRVTTPTSAPSDFIDSRFTSPFSSISQSRVLDSPRKSSGLSEYTLARVADHTRREEHLAQIQLAKWATDLQCSLQNERMQYERLARDERAAWLTKRLDECVADGMLVPIGHVTAYEKETGVLTVHSHDGRQLRYRTGNMSASDPLGLIRWNEDMKRRGWIVLQVIGGVGFVGGLALWLARTLGLTSHDLSNWIRAY
ncbi:hypothetical protein CIHG_04181 [Coccidioides immitis H538.4]|uniref:Septin-type G domain-containing protein n=3 Tax=Coccidioides immitis TaxID=5501 RepID=A0A0J8TI07_COCIT|nr:hypothetical protein CIRG_04572 [Coccidioides immitis RMSCC 2394]KMU73357.1 hypothetical protein CISG_10087 [Coccidioides immitis RMSCC 3703]KMU86392.1 hypothetical protein CIHG_04181 [Coccidioides immitis H538.4]